MRLSNSTPRCLRKLDLLRRHLALEDSSGYWCKVLAVRLYSEVSRTRSLKENLSIWVVVSTLEEKCVWHVWVFGALLAAVHSFRLLPYMVSRHQVTGPSSACLPAYSLHALHRGGSHTQRKASTLEHCNAWTGCILQHNVTICQLLFQKPAHSQLSNSELEVTLCFDDSGSSFAKVSPDIR